MTRALHKAVLALLDASPRIVLWRDRETHVDGKVVLFDGQVEDTDEAAATISAQLPYLVFFATPGRPARPRVGRGSTMREVEFQITAVGEDRNQALAASEVAEALLDEKTVTPAGDRPRRIRRTPDSPYVGEDPKWTRPDGGPLFMAVTRYGVYGRRPATTT